MDFRIIDIDGHQILLERMEDDGRWVIVLGVYIEKTNRFDEWIACADYEQVRALIAEYEPQQARSFLGRGQAWYQAERQRRAKGVPLELQQNSLPSERGQAVGNQ